MQRADKFLIIVFSILIWSHPSIGQESIEKELKTTLINIIHQRYAEIATKDIKIEIKNKKQLQNRSLKDKQYYFDTKADSYLLGDTVLPLVIKNNASTERISVFVEIEAVMPFFKTSRFVNKGELLTTENVELTIEDARQKSAFTINNRDAFLGQETTTSLPKHTILTSHFVRPLPKVRRGDPVKLIITDDGIELILNGIAIEDGQLNQQIRVKSKQYKKELIGRVISSNNVKINLSY